MAKIIPIPRIFGGILITFLAFLGIRITYPMVSLILALFTDTTSMMYWVAVLSTWLIYVFVLWVVVWVKFLEPMIGGET